MIMQKFKTKLVLVVALLLSISALQAQNVQLKSGMLDFLKGESSVNVEYVYDGLMVGKLTEKAYIEKKVAEDNKKESGKGDHWLQSWKNDRTARFEPKFETLLNKQFTERKVNLKFGANQAAEYTLIVKTKAIEPGWNVSGIIRHNAEVSIEAVFVETKNRTKELAVVTITKAPGRDANGFDYDVGYRLQEAYAKAGKELGVFICNNGLK
jgi:hypothetical protein